MRLKRPEISDPSRARGHIVRQPRYRLYRTRIQRKVFSRLFLQTSTE